MGRGGGVHDTLCVLVLVTLANGDKGSNDPVGGVAKPVVENLPGRSSKRLTTDDRKGMGKQRG
jgi:hypothetical protein